MKIAFLSVSAEMGGSEVSLLELVKGLRRLAPDWPIDVVVPREGMLSQAVRRTGATAYVVALPDRLMRVGEAGGIGRRRLLGRGASMLLAAGTVPQYSRRLGRLLSDLAPDIIHTNGFKLHVLGARAAPRGAALVWHLHEYIGRRPISRRLLHRHLGHVSAIVANSRSVAREVSDVLEPPVPIATIYNAVDPREFAPTGDALDLDGLAGLPPAPFGTVRVGLVATYGRWKGHATFIEAMRRVATTTPCRGYIVGGALYDTSGSQHTAEELERQIDAAGLRGRVGLTGFVQRPAAAIRALDIVVHASTEPEPFGLVIAEGMTAARAVIVSGAGGAAELVANEVDALTHVPGDPDDLARCIARLANDAGLRDRLATAARQSAIRCFDPNAFTTAFMNVYEMARARTINRAPQHVGE